MKGIGLGCLPLSKGLGAKTITSHFSVYSNILSICSAIHMILLRCSIHSTFLCNVFYGMYIVFMKVCNFLIRLTLYLVLRFGLVLRSLERFCNSDIHTLNRTACLVKNTHSTFLDNMFFCKYNLASFFCWMV